MVEEIVKCDCGGVPLTKCIECGKVLCRDCVIGNWVHNPFCSDCYFSRDR